MLIKYILIECKNFQDILNKVYYTLTKNIVHFQIAIYVQDHKIKHCSAKFADTHTHTHTHTQKKVQLQSWCICFCYYIYLYAYSCNMHPKQIKAGDGGWMEWRFRDSALLVSFFIVMLLCQFCI